MASTASNPVKFNYTAARNAGFSDAQIAASLKAKRSRGMTVFVDRAEVERYRTSPGRPTTASTPPVAPVAAVSSHAPQDTRTAVAALRSVPEAPQPAVAGPGAPPEIVRGFQGGLVGQNVEAVGRAASAAGLRGPGEALVRAGQGQAQAPKVASFREVRSAKDLFDYLQFQAGQGIASTVPSVVGAAAGAATGARVGPAGAAVGAAVGAGLPAYALNFGDVSEEVDRALPGASPARRAQIAAMISAPITALDIIPSMRFGGRAAKKLLVAKVLAEAQKRGLIERVFKEGAKGLTMEGLTEGVQEATQALSVAGVAGQEVDPDELITRAVDATIGGALAGGTIGGAVEALPQRGGATPAAPPAPSSGPSVLETVGARANIEAPRTVPAHLATAGQEAALELGKAVAEIEQAGPVRFETPDLTIEDAHIVPSLIRVFPGDPNGVRVSILDNATGQLHSLAMPNIGTLRAALKVGPPPAPAAEVAPEVEEAPAAEPKRKRTREEYAADVEAQRQTEVRQAGAAKSIAALERQIAERPGDKNVRRWKRRLEGLKALEPSLSAVPLSELVERTKTAKGADRKALAEEIANREVGTSPASMGPTDVTKASSWTSHLKTVRAKAKANPKDIAAQDDAFRAEQNFEAWKAREEAKPKAGTVEPVSATGRVERAKPSAPTGPAAPPITSAIAPAKAARIRVPNMQFRDEAAASRFAIAFGRSEPGSEPSVVKTRKGFEVEINETPAEEKPIGGKSKVIREPTAEESKTMKPGERREVGGVVVVKPLAETERRLKQRRGSGGGATSFGEERGPEAERRTPEAPRGRRKEDRATLAEAVREGRKRLDAIRKAKTREDLLALYREQHRNEPKPGMTDSEIRVELLDEAESMVKGAVQAAEPTKKKSPWTESQMERGAEIAELTDDEFIALGKKHNFIGKKTKAFPNKFDENFVREQIQKPAVRKAAANNIAKVEEKNAPTISYMHGQRPEPAKVEEKAAVSPKPAEPSPPPTATPAEVPAAPIEAALVETEQEEAVARLARTSPSVMTANAQRQWLEIAANSGMPPALFTKIVRHWASLLKRGARTAMKPVEFADTYGRLLAAIDSQERQAELGARKLEAVAEMPRGKAKDMARAEVAEKLADVGTEGLRLTAARKALDALTSLDAIQKRVDEVVGKAPPISTLPAGVAEAIEAGQKRVEGIARRDPVLKENAKPKQPEAVKRILEALKGAKPVREKQEAAYTAERIRRIQQSAARERGTQGQARLHARLSALKGKYPKVEFESIAKALTQENVDELVNIILQHPALEFFEGANAGIALQKLLGEGGGTVPTRSELELLEIVFGVDFVKAIMDIRPKVLNAKALGYAFFNVSRTLRTSFDLSAPLRQGLYFGASYPKEWGSAFVAMHRYWASEKQFQEGMEELYRDPLFKLARRGKLSITRVGSADISAQEEALYGMELAEQIPLGIGGQVRRSGRAYVGFLNKLRFDVFKALYRMAERSGPVTDARLREIAGLVNAGTGRGDSKFIDDHAQGLNAIFFSIRLQKSRIELLNPRNYVAGDPFVRRQYIRSSVLLAADAALVLTIAAWAGARVEWERRNGDWGKIRVGKNVYDILGGLVQYLRLYPTVAEALFDQATGRKPRYGTADKILTRFAEHKLSPVATFAVNWLRNTASERDIGGRRGRFEIGPELLRLFVPMVMEDFFEVMKSDPRQIPVAVPAAVYGVSVGMYPPPR